MMTSLFRLQATPFPYVYSRPASAASMEFAQMQQFHMGSSPFCSEINETSLDEQHEKLQATLLGLCPAHLWHNGSYSAGCPRPILINKHHQQRLERLHEALVISITDIVQRWWSDGDARFPERMPLRREEEDLLKASLAAMACPKKSSNHLP
jgi:hypothetical protein